VHLLGQGESAADFARRRAEELTTQGRRPYLTPGGGSNSISALGYVRCALELDTQMNSNGLDDAIVVTANGSNATHTGLLAGFKALGHLRSQDRPIMTADLNASYRSFAPDPNTLSLKVQSDGDSHE
jgi:1-aminocyclopropane-1-carboxylate deaminase/D-cysteine desulfhydrase-like pyridoxal-dependent ACC family enzyme